MKHCFIFETERDKKHPLKNGMNIKIEKILIGKRFGFLFYAIAGTLQVLEVGADEAKNILNHIMETNATITEVDLLNDDLLTEYVIS